MGGHRGPCASCSRVKVLDFIQKLNLLQESLGCWNGIEGPDQWEMPARTTGVDNTVGDGGWVGKKFRLLNQECLMRAPGWHSR